MKETELRIGNYYKQEATKTLLRNKPTIYRDEKVFLMTKHLLIDYLTNPITYEFTPIPLTEEWLLKFGLKYKKTKVISGAYSECYKDDEIFSIHDFGITGWVCRWDGRRLRKIKYVHQLQNLYFALNENELIK